jgi:hypothetical protein
LVASLLTRNTILPTADELQVGGLHADIAAIPDDSKLYFGTEQIPVRKRKKPLPIWEKAQF